MAEKPKGSIIYEILIVILIAVLIGTILYPARVWENEEELQSVCQTRMETIQNMELFFYISDPSSGNTYTDSIPKLKEVVFSKPDNLVTLDTLVNWDGLITDDDLKQLILGSQFPEELRAYVLTKVQNREPLGNLGVWDSLNVRLVHELHQLLEDAEFSRIGAVDSGIVWQTLVGENEFQNILSSPTVSSRIRTNTQNLVRRGQDIISTSGWNQFQPLFYQELVSIVETAERTDVWQEDEEDQWEKVKKEEWSADMDTLSSAVRDSLWQEYQLRFWENEKEIIWRKERNKLWKNERDEWTEANTSLWERSLTQQWESERKATWEGETLETLSDSLAEIFPAQKDSLWRVVVDSIRTEEYGSWKQDNKRDVDELIHTVWENARRITWEDETFQTWIAEMEADREALWGKIKEEMWNTERITLWQEEEVRLTEKNAALKRLDQSVKWASVLGMGRMEEIINQLDLPDNEGMWKAVDQSDPAKGSSLYQLGIVGLFRKALIDSVALCPVAHLPYLIQVDDTSTIKRISIRCPIVDTSDVVVALKVDPKSNDTSEVVIQQSTVQKLIGGGSVKNHGLIDMDGAKSWERTGS
ncbi:hypothetical protein JW824_09475 [bacterium]|nr:hypothetical protein [bacterium]RQV94320.1 MAG: hypothetical protein EH221_07675 [bacterium]